MSKYGDERYHEGEGHTTKPGKRTTKYTTGNAASDMRHNHIKEGPRPGEKSGIGRLDGPEGFKGK